MISASTRMEHIDAVIYGTRKKASNTHAAIPSVFETAVILQ